MQRRIGDLATIARGASPRPIQDSKWFDVESDIGWLRISDVTEQNGRIYHLQQHLSELGQAKTRVLNNPHLLLSIAATVGKPVINYVKTGVHDGFLIFFYPKFEREFMFQWLEMFRPQWRKYGQPGSQVNLNSELVRNQKIAIPNLQEQYQIGNFFEKFDNLIALYQRKIQQLNLLKKEYLKGLFPQKDSKIPKYRFKEFTDDWELRRFGEITNLCRGLTYKPSDISASGVRVLRSSNISEGTFVLKDDDVFVSPSAINIDFARENNILITSANGSSRLVGKHAIIKNLHDYAVHGGFMLLATVKKPEFVNALMSSPWYSKFINTYVAGGNGAIGNLSKRDLEEQNVLVPNDTEQDKIGLFFANLDNLITLHQRKLEQLQSIKKVFLNSMFI